MGRTKGIGGTDASAIVGLNPHKTELDVFLEKTGQKEDQPDNENMWWGRAMEPVLAKRYKQETGAKLFIPKIKTLPYRLQSPEWYCGSPDALVNPAFMAPIPVSEGGVDFKTSGRPQDWGEPGTDEVPDHYVIQAEWYMGLTGAQWWDIAVLLMGFTRKFAIYRINRDDELIGNLTEACGKFWTDHVLTRTPPPLDGSKSASEYVKRLYPRDQGPMLEPTDQEILNLIDSYRATRKAVKIWEDQEALLENQLKALVADFSGMQGAWGKITWKRSKDSESVDWKGLANEIMTEYINSKHHQEYFQRHTTIRPGTRRWLPKFKEELNG